MPKTHDVSAVVGEKKDGNPRWMRCGSLIEKDGKLRLKLDAYPVSGDGWFALFPVDQQQAPQSAPPQTGGTQDPNDEIPFAPAPWWSA